MRHRNLIGPQIRKLRVERGWTQDYLAIKLQLSEFDVSRSGLAKIEARLVWVGDHELLYFTHVFKVSLPALYPDTDDQDPDFPSNLDRIMERRPRNGQ